MNPDDFKYLSEFVHRTSGLSLSEDKVYLLESRLGPVAKKNSLADLSALVQALKVGKPANLSEDVTEAMTTNESFFFRDGKPFEIFRSEILPSMTAARASSKKLRIWCAAASTGQEPYTISMVIKEAGAALAGWRINILGTDLSRPVLEKAKVGLYSQFEVQRGLPVTMLVKYFEQMNEMWQIDSALRAMVDYREQNLLEDFTGLGTFDIVFCRNVLIYFDRDTKARVLEHMSRVMAPDGVLFLGGAETVLGISKHFAPFPGQRGVYRVVSDAEEVRAAS